MNTFGIYAALTTTHDIAPCKHLLNMGRKNLSQCRITNGDIIVCISCLLKYTLFWGTPHDIMKFPDRHLQ